MKQQEAPDVKVLLQEGEHSKYIPFCENFTVCTFNMERINFLNIEVDNLTMNQAVAEIERMVLNRSNAYLVTPNVNHIILVEENEKFRNAYEDANLVLTDGKPLIWISKYLGVPIVEKVSGSDLFPCVCEMAAAKGYSVYLLGAAQGVADKAARNLKNRFPGLNIVGTYSPSYGFEKDEAEINEIISKINLAHPDILAVSFGSPKGEIFIHQYRSRLNVPVSMQIGATLDFMAGTLKRSPRWMSACGIEWLYRITREPTRLAGRYWYDAKKIIPIVRKYKNLERRNENSD